MDHTKKGGEGLKDNITDMGRTDAPDTVDAGFTETVQDEFLDAVAEAFCPECGKAIIQNARGRRKKFCSDACRFTWKNRHPKPENWKMVTLTCQTCGREFQTRGYGEVKRKYCSRACANRGRTNAVEQR